MTTRSVSGSNWGTFLADYARASAAPLACLVFTAPILAVYECGILFWPDAMRNGADVWLRAFLEVIGFGQLLLLPLLTCGVLLGWHHVRRDRWRVGGMVLYGMFLESTALACLLLILAHAHQAAMASIPSVSGSTLAACSFGSNGVPKMIAFLGAGIYEELLFRLLLLPSVAIMLRWAGWTRATSLLGAVLLSSLVFAAAHYRLDVVIGPWHLATSFGEPFQVASFLFRLLAGMFFSAVFLYRGFGIAVAHAFYDILVTVL